MAQSSPLSPQSYSFAAQLNPRRINVRHGSLVTMFARTSTLDIFSTTFNFGGLPHEDVKRSMRLFAKEVMPAFKDVVPPMVAEQAAVAPEPVSPA